MAGKNKYRSIQKMLDSAESLFELESGDIIGLDSNGRLMRYEDGRGKNGLGESEGEQRLFEYGKVVDPTKFAGSPAERRQVRNWFAAALLRQNEKKHGTEVPVAAELRIERSAVQAHQHERTLRRVDWLFDIAGLLARKRIADEEIGDALEQIHEYVAKGRSRWFIYARAVMAVFFTLLHSIRETSSALQGKDKKA